MRKNLKLQKARTKKILCTRLGEFIRTTSMKNCHCKDLDKFTFKKWVREKKANQEINKKDGGGNVVAFT